MSPPSPYPHLGPEAMLRAVGIEALVPDAYAEYRPLVVDALGFFLGELSPQRIAAAVTEQMALPITTPPHERLGLLCRTSPVLHKLGQLLARDMRLDPLFRLGLQTLESMAPTTPLQPIASIIDAAWPDVPGLTVGPRALAEASVAVVVPFEWRRRRGADPVHGVFKVLRPGVEERLAEDLEIWSDLGDFLEERCAALGLPALEYRATFDSLRRLLANEVRLEQEQRHLEEAAAFYGGDPALVIPELLPFSTPAMTAMTRLDGTKVTDAGLAPDVARRAADTIVDALIARPFWQADPASVPLHADPHAGNLLMTPDDRLGIVDWALVTRLEKAQAVAVVQAVVGALMGDEAMTVRALGSLGRITAEAAVRDAVAEALAEVRRGVFPGFTWLMALLDRLGVAGALVFPENMALFRKNVLTLAGVVRDVAPDVDVDTVMMRRLMAVAGAEAPARFMASASSRDFGLHLSNADLWGMWAGSSQVAARYWWRMWQDMLGGE